MRIKKIIILVLALIITYRLSGEENTHTDKGHDEDEGDGHDHSETSHGHDDEEKSTDSKNDHEDHSGTDKNKHDHDQGHDENHQDGLKEDGEKGHEHSEEEEEGHGHEGGGKAIGDGKAILEVNEKEGFRLSAESTAILGIKYVEVNKLPPQVPIGAFVFNRNEKGFYRMRGGFYKLVKTQEELQIGDQIVVEGVDLLNVAGIFSTDKSEYGHSH